MKKRLRLLLLSILHALLMLFLSYSWLSLPYTFGDESFLIKWSSLIKKSLLGIDRKPAADEFLFIDISGLRTTVATENEFGEHSPYYQEVITNRLHLAELLDMTQHYGADSRIVLLDVLLADRTPHDSILQCSVDALRQNLLSVSHLQGGEQLIRPVLDIPHALSTYRASQGIFLKYPLLLGDTLKTVPLVMAERLDDLDFRQQGGVHRLDGRLSFPSPIIDFKIRPSDFRTGQDTVQSVYTVYPAGFLLESTAYMDSSSLAAYFRDKIVVIGDFTYDLHDTPFGKMAGPIIICNAYLTLARGDNIISPLWVCFMVLGFSLVSYRIFIGQRVQYPIWTQRLFRSPLGRAILDSLDDFFILTAITLLSFFLFDIHVNILILLIYLQVIAYLVRRYWLKETQASA